MTREVFGPIELVLFLGAPLLLSLGALTHHLWTERRRAPRAAPPHDPTEGGHHDPKD